MSTGELSLPSLPAFLRIRLELALPPQFAETLLRYMLRLIKENKKPPLRVGGPDWRAIAAQSNLPLGALIDTKTALVPLFGLLCRELGNGAKEGGLVSPTNKQKVTKRRGRRRFRKPQLGAPLPMEFPEPLFAGEEDPAEFHEALAMQMLRHGDNIRRLYRALGGRSESPDVRTISSWYRGLKAPRTVQSLRSLALIEQRYRLPLGYFKAKLPHLSRAATGHQLGSVSMAERRRLAWHLPDDFDARSAAEQSEILTWIRSVIVSGATEYRRYQAQAMRERFAVQFREDSTVTDHSRFGTLDDETGLWKCREGAQARTIAAPEPLAREMASLLAFKTSILTEAGFQRCGVWGGATAQQKVEHIGLMFGAMAAPRGSQVKGFGIHPDRLTFALLLFPAVWDWYLNWRVKRRGFYTAWEIDMLRVGSALTRAETGWMRQNRWLASRLQPIRGLVSPEDIAATGADWDATCDTVHRHLNNRAREIQRVARVHRDPFEAILPVLESDKPLAEYRRIADEVRRRVPDRRRFPLAAAEAVRSYLILRLGMHLGVRQKNLRQLLFADRDGAPRTERYLTDQLRGELRWSTREGGWEVFIPSAAFKNADSSYFGNKPFQLLLPNLDGLYDFIAEYLESHRAVLLRRAADPGTFFIKTVKQSSRNAAYDQNTFYEAWRLVIQRYGVFNPYTGKGAIKGLLPHGPHNIRDVLATHILKCTGSYEQASYAIQDTPDMVAQHYGRFLPKDKAAIAAQVLNKVWETV